MRHGPGSARASCHLCLSARTSLLGPSRERRGPGGPDVNAYDPESYWSRVADEIRTRPATSFVAGEDTPYLAKYQELHGDLKQVLEEQGLLAKPKS